MPENIIAGLISGLFVALFILVFRSIWNRIVVAWFEERIYKDAKIEGKWFSLYPASNGLRQETISLNRHGHAVTGRIICTNGADEGQEYAVQGSFRNLILPLIYENDDSTKTERGTITLKSVENGQRLEGKVASYYDSRDIIVALDVIWFRSKEDSDRMAKAKYEEREKLKDMTDSSKHSIVEEHIERKKHISKKVVKK